MRFLLLALLTLLLLSCATYDYMEAAAPEGETLTLTQDSVTIYFLRPEGLAFSPRLNDFGPSIVEVYAHNQPLGPVAPNSFMRARLPLADDGTVLLSARFWDYSNLRLSTTPGATHYVHLHVIPQIGSIDVRFNLQGPVDGPEMLERCKKEAPVRAFAATNAR